MAYPILNSEDFYGYKFDNTGDLAIVYEGPYSKAKLPHPITPEILQRIANWNIGPRLSSIHIVCPYHREPDKDKYPLRELRAGWLRVRKELELISPSVKRVLLISQSSLLTQVVMKGVKGLPDTHGTIFTLADGLEVVPTFFKVYEHMREWRDRDVERWISLVKGKPLLYRFSLPTNISTPYIVVDLETSGLDPRKEHITVLGVQWDNNQRALVYSDPNIAYGIKLLTEYVKRGGHVFFHNGQFDLGFMGTEFRDAVVEHDAVHCTMIRGRARGELVNTLKHLGNYYTDRPGNYAWAVEGEEHDFTDPAYVTEDLEVTWQLAREFLEDGNKPVVKQFEQAIVMASEQTLAGSFVHKEKLDTLFEEGKANIARLELECIAEYGVQPGKTKEMVAVLLQRGHELTKRTPSGGYALDEEVCEEHGLELLLQYRKAIKLDSSFVGKIKKLLRNDGTLPHYQSMLGAETGRTTMSNFNHQQAAKRGPVRGLIISRFDNGKILIVDLAQAELRVLAYISDDEVYAKLFDVEDPHRANASRALGIPESEVTEDQRDDAKSVIFRTVYGGSSQNPGQRRVEVFFKSSFVKAFRWIDAIRILSKERLSVTDNYGKTRNLLEVKTWRGMGGVGRAGINSPIQGIASHISMQVTYFAWRLFRKFGLRSKIIFGVHDSVVGDIHPDEIEIAQKLVRLSFAKLRETHLYKAFRLAKTLPMTGELLIGESWGWIDANKKKLPAITCSSHDIITEDDI